MSMKGQSTSGCALATACGVSADLFEKKPAILSFSDGAGGVGGGTAGVEAAATPAGAAGGAAAVGGAAVVTALTLLLLQPDAISASNNKAATGKRSLQRIGQISGGIPRFIAVTRDALDLIPNQPWPSQGTLPFRRGRGSESEAVWLTADRQDSGISFSRA
jgi:hypothetical protein